MAQAFYIWLCFMENVLGNKISDVEIELYANAQMEGEPFAVGTYSRKSGSWSGKIEFSLIKSTSVYLKISGI